MCSQPSSDRAWAESPSANAKTRDCTAHRWFEDRDARDRQQFSQFNSGKSVTELLNAIGQRSGRH
jgi:hypothetical protein